MADFDLLARQYMGDNYYERCPKCPSCGKDTSMVGFIPKRTYQVYCGNPDCNGYLETQNLQPDGE